MKIHTFRLRPGQDLRKEIEAFATANHILAGWMITCVGSLQQTQLRFANRDEGTKEFGHFEIASLTGTISVNGCHVHASLSNASGKTTGGHLLYENIIYTTAEIVIGESDDLILERKIDAQTGWVESTVSKVNSGA